MDKPLVYFRIAGHVLHSNTPCEKLEKDLQKAIVQYFGQDSGITADIYIIGHPYNCPCSDSPTV